MSNNPLPYSYPTSLPPGTNQQEGRKIILVGAAALLLLAGGYYLFGGRGEKLSRMSVSDAHVTQLGAAGNPVTEINRGEAPEVFYQVVLRDVPLGDRLLLNCEWVDPSGQVARHNRYRTNYIYKSTWPTHCREHFGPASLAGEWHVRLLLGPRLLSDSSFLLR